jgi:hypothetical protein
MNDESHCLCHRMEACYPTLTLYVAALKVIPRTGDNIFLVGMSIGFAMAETLSCSRTASREAAAGLRQEDELEVDSDRCIMTYMGKMKEGWYACYR